MHSTLFSYTAATSIVVTISLAVMTALTADVTANQSQAPPTSTLRPPGSTSEPGLSVDDFYLWLPLIVVVLFTAIMIGLILVGRRQDRNNVESPPALPTSPIDNEDVLSTTLPPPTKKPTVASKDSGEGPQMDLLSVLVVVVIFVVCVVVCGILGFQNKRRRQENPQEETATLNSGLETGEETVQVRTTNHGDAPDTPPPTYSMIERQTSYVSYISQTSSQCSIPPDYDEATQLPDADFNANRTSRLARTSSGGRHPPPRRSASGNRRNSSLRQLRARFLGRRSHSAVETQSPRRNTSQGSSVSDANDIGDHSTVTSELSEVFSDSSPSRQVAEQSLPEEEGEIEDVVPIEEVQNEEGVTQEEGGRVQEESVQVQWDVGDVSSSNHSTLEHPPANNLELQTRTHTPSGSST